MPQEATRGASGNQPPQFGFRNLGFRLQGLGFRVGFRIQGLGFVDSGCRA